MSRINVGNFRHPDGTSDNITLDSSTNATVAGNLTASGNSTVTGNLTVNGTGNQSIAGTLQFNSGYGSVATAYGVRAWVNFNGTGSVSSNQTINGSGNVSSVWKNGTGQYTVNFANAMPDANYSVVAEAAGGNTGNIVGDIPQTTQVNIVAYNSNWSTGDRNPACVAVFR